MSEKVFCSDCTHSRRLINITNPNIYPHYGHINCRECTYGYTLLHDAVRRSQPIMFDMLISNPHIDLNVADKDGNTPLHLAIIEREINFAMRLIKSGCDVNKRNRDGDTPLMFAISINEVTLAHEILKRGAADHIDELNDFGNTVCDLSCMIRNFKILDLLIFYNADPRIRNAAGETLFMRSLKNLYPVECQICIFEFEYDMNEVSSCGMSTLFLAIKSETPLLEEIINRGADINYLGGNGLNALRLALQTSNGRAFDLVWPRFDYQHAYDSYLSPPLLSEFFHNQPREDWLHCYSIVSNSHIMEHAVQHYSSHDKLPPLISQVVRAFARHNLDETELFPYVCVLVSYGARVLLRDIETVYICYGDNSDTLDFLYDMDVELGQSDSCYISYPYIMFKVSGDVNKIFNDYRLHGWLFKLWGEALVFLPKLFQFCTPTQRYIHTICLYSHWMETEYYANWAFVGNDLLQVIVTAYAVLKNELTAKIGTMCFPPSLMELSRNAARNRICLQYKIERYSEYRRLLLSLHLPEPILKILLFKKPLKNSINTSLPSMDTWNRIRANFISNRFYNNY